MTHQAHHTRAFTLVELLIVLAILGIAALAILPSGASAQSTRAFEAARLLADALDTAALTSLGRGADPCVLVVDADGGGFMIALQSDPGTPIIDTMRNREMRWRFSEGEASSLAGVGLDASALTDGRTLAYGPDGLPQANAAIDLVLTSGGISRVVRVDHESGLASLP